MFNGKIYAIRISDLLAIPDREKRWILVKKALAFDARQVHTKSVEFAYGSLEGATRHLREVEENRTEFLFIHEGAEPKDDSDKYSSGPKLQDFARRNHVKGIPIPKKSDTVVFRIANVKDTSPKPKEISALIRGEHSIPAVKLPVSVDSPAVELPKDIVPLAIAKTSNLKKETNMTENTSDMIEISLNAVAAISDERARWIMVRKLVARVCNVKYVRGVKGGKLGTYDNAMDFLVSQVGKNGVVSFPADKEPIDTSDEGKSPVSIVSYVRTGNWNPNGEILETVVPNVPDVPDVQDQPETVGITTGQEITEISTEVAPVEAESSTDASVVVNPESGVIRLAQFNLDDELISFSNNGDENSLEWLSRHLEDIAARVRYIANKRSSPIPE